MRADEELKTLEDKLEDEQSKKENLTYSAEEIDTTIKQRENE